MSRRYPKEVHEFIRNNVGGRSAGELVQMVTSEFGIEMTVPQMQAYKKNHNLKSGTPRCKPKGYCSDTFPRPVVDFIQDHYEGVGPSEMAVLLNDKFGTEYTKQQLKAYYANHHINSGLTGWFEKGNVPYNKGQKGIYASGSEKGWYQKGHEPHNKTPIGTIRKRSDGYLYEKYGPGPLDWKPHHQLVWERAYGPQPEGHMIIFKDNDHDNCSLENLVLVPMAESCIMNRKNLRCSDPALTETGMLVAKVINAVNKKRKAKHEEEE